MNRKLSVGLALGLVGLLAVHENFRGLTNSDETPKRRSEEHPLVGYFLPSSALRSKQSSVASDEPTSVVEGTRQLQELNGTEPLFDEKGWHFFDPKDIVTAVMHPEELPPFYLLPVILALKLILTMVVFGVGIRFTEKEDGDAIVPIAKKVLEVVMIFMVLNGYWHDYERLIGIVDGAYTTCHRVGYSFIVWSTSANYVACRAIWQLLMLENPRRLLGLTPKSNFIAMPWLGVPLCPGMAKWLHLLKHIYALILLPYFLPYYFANAFVGCVMFIWCCFTKFSLCISLCGFFCNFCSALVGTLFTLGMFYASDCRYWWPVIQPALYFLFIQAWATLIAPAVFGGLYGVVICSSLDNIKKGISAGYSWTLCARQPSTQNSGTPYAILQADDVKVLVAYNRSLLVEDFDLGSEALEAEEATKVADLDDSKVEIFVAALRNMSSIAAEQLFLIFVVRAMFDTDEYTVGNANYVHSMRALHRTLSERTWGTYHLHFTTLMQQLAGHGSFSRLVNALNIFL